LENAGRGCARVAGDISRFNAGIGTSSPRVRRDLRKSDWGCDVDMGVQDGVRELVGWEDKFGAVGV
jgi:hypothetical protein